MRKDPICRESLRANDMRRHNDVSQQMQLTKPERQTEGQQIISLRKKLKLAEARLEISIRRETFYREMSLKYSRGIAKLLPILLELHEDRPITGNGFI